MIGFGKEKKREINDKSSSFGLNKLVLIGLVEVTELLTKMGRLEQKSLGWAGLANSMTNMVTC
jgi:hypothetical protein